jgi:hypothetical protein
MKRVAWIGLVVPLAGCVIPFVHNRRELPRPPDAVQRFSSEAQALGSAPGAPALPEVTRSMGAAIEALPDVKDGDQLARAVRKQADAMKQRGPDQTDALARASLDAALEAVRRARPSVPQGVKDTAVELARQAVGKVAPGQRATVDAAYLEVARAMVVVTGGGAAATGSELSQLVARFAVDQPDDARGTGAQAIAAIGDALLRLPHPPAHANRTARELRKRADRLATAPALEYAGQLKDALSLVVGAFERSSVPPAQRQLLDEAKVAVDAIRDDRPLDLQHATATLALKRVIDAIEVGISAR